MIIRMETHGSYFLSDISLKWATANLKGRNNAYQNNRIIYETSAEGVVTDGL